MYNINTNKLVLVISKTLIFSGILAEGQEVVRLQIYLENQNPGIPHTQSSLLELHNGATQSVSVAAKAKQNNFKEKEKYLSEKQQRLFMIVA